MALSNAEKQRRYIARLKAGVGAASELAQAKALLDQARERILQLEEHYALRGQVLDIARRELETPRLENLALKAAQDPRLKAALAGKAM